VEKLIKKKKSKDSKNAKKSKVKGEENDDSFFDFVKGEKA
jgi:hypothetical protein